jgi:hypothetical protein
VIEQKIKNYFSYYLKENVLVFDISCYIDELSVHVLDFAYDWDLFKNGLIKCSDKLIKELLQRKIKSELEDFIKVSNENNCKILSYSFDTANVKEWHSFYEEPNKMTKMCKSICKKNLPNFVEFKTNKKLFTNKKGSFLNFTCIIPSGEDEEFLLKKLDKLKNINK